MFEVNLNKKEIAMSLVLSALFSVLLGLYMGIVENSSLFYELNGFDYLKLMFSVVSVKHILVFFIVLFLAIAILTNGQLRKTSLDFIFKNRFIIALIVLIATVALQLHGSSLGVITFGGDAHQSLLGAARWTRVDEYTVNTLFAFSQYYNDFSYFSEIARAFTTDMFAIGEQPIFDFVGLFRPFYLGYLFFSPGVGLSICWMGRLIALILVSFEFGMLLSRKNKILSLAYTILVSFSPLVQWWFGVNGVIEMLVFGQLAILLLDRYMNLDSYFKRFLCVLGLFFSLTTYALTIYPAWEVTFGYVFLAIALWVVYMNWSNFNKTKSDVLFGFILIALCSISLFYVFTKSVDAITLMSNTVYPGLRDFYGGVTYYSLSGDPFVYLDYMRNIFEPLKPAQLISKVSMSYFISFFPLGLILFSIVQFVQKKKDVLLYLLIAVYIFLLAYYLFTFPEFVGRLTLLSRTQPSRLFVVITFIDLLILIRSMTLIEKGNYHKLSLISPVIVGIMLILAYIHFGDKYYTWPILLVAFLMFTPAFYFIFNGADRRSRIGFLIMVVIISVPAGAMVNPVESGADYFFDMPPLTEVKNIVSADPDGIWIVDGGAVQSNALLTVGAHTLNSVNPYPNFNMWSKLFPDGEYRDVYNRFSYININLVNDTATNVSCGDNEYSLYKSDQVFLSLNVNDLEKLNVSYIVSVNDLTQLSNDNVTFTPIYKYNTVNIFRVD